MDEDQLKALEAQVMKQAEVDLTKGETIAKEAIAEMEREGLCPLTIALSVLTHGVEIPAMHQEKNKQNQMIDMMIRSLARMDSKLQTADHGLQLVN